MKLPKLLYIAWAEVDSREPYLVAEKTPEEVIQDNGPTEIGTYKLITKGTFVKKATLKSGSVTR